MAKETDSRCKKCRRVGEKLFLKGDRCFGTKCAMVKRNYPPGIHGPKNQRSFSNFGLQLREKQKAKRIYGILERQFKNYYTQSIKKRGKTGEIIFSMLEKRLDNVIYRSGFATSRKLARQLVNHGSFQVNSKNVNIPSFQVKIGDEVKVKKNKLEKSKYWQEIVKDKSKKDIPEWLSVNTKEYSIKIGQNPEEKDFENIIDMNQIVEFYSK